MVGPASPFLQTREKGILRGDSFALMVKALLLKKAWSASRLEEKSASFFLHSAAIHSLGAERRGPGGKNGKLEEQRVSFLRA